MKKRDKIYGAAKAAAPGFMFHDYKDLGKAGAEFKLRGKGSVSHHRLLAKLNKVGYTIARHDYFSPTTDTYRVRRLGAQTRLQTRLPKGPRLGSSGAALEVKRRAEAKALAEAIRRAK